MGLSCYGARVKRILRRVWDVIGNRADRFHAERMRRAAPGFACCRDERERDAELREQYFRHLLG